MNAREILDDPNIGSRYFFPRPDRVSDPFVVRGADVELACLHTPGDPLLLHFHGNGETVADWAPELPPRLRAGGVGSLLAEYRGYGGSTGVPALGAMLDDALAVIDAAPVAPDRIVVYGRSVGSIFALHVAAHRPVAGVIIESGIADVRERLLLRVEPSELGLSPARFDAVISECLDHRAKLRASKAPVLVLHAAGDHIVSPEHAKSIAAWAGERATLKMFAQGDHNTIFAYNAEAIVKQTVSFTRRVTDG